uniref:Uncharacterized LOC100186945 n=1 Tax=Ciona intestinalis TaxID=7719 RepID=H2XK49_CIOIN|nr:uncharacterized protein LOC100186945 [Ciona intestinalis]|eukprot:XP_002131361.1 uncharacterized protein LOC100186945 [Ciona intestinalis]
MAPNSNALPGINDAEVSPLRENERPVWSRGGTLVRRPPVRHYIPKHPFYYSSTEMFETQNKPRATYEADTKKFVTSVADSDARRAFSAPASRVTHSYHSVKSTGSGKLNREKTSRSSLHSNIPTPGVVPWVSTPVPGMRTIQDYDFYRRTALDHKNTNIYHIKSGLLPKFMGYVPGLKFRYGSTFGMLTYNAKEVGVERSATWGGAVSLF